MTTYYVRTDGNNGNTGTTNSSGGAWADPGYASGQMADGDICYVKSGTYTLTTSTVSVAGGPVRFTDTTRRLMEGFDVTPGDMAGTVVLDAGSQTGVSLFYLDGGVGESQHIVNMIADGNSGTGNSGFEFADDRCSVVSCLARDCPSAGFRHAGGGGGYVIASKAEGCGNGFYRILTAINCWADSCTRGFEGNTVGINSYSNCLATNSTNEGFGEILYSVLVNCATYSNGGTGFDTTSTGARGISFVNCLSVSDGGYAFEGGDAVLMVNCASYSPTSGRTNTTPIADIGAITLTGDPFVDAAGGDFRANSTSGAGDSIRGAGIGIYGQTTNVDVNGLHHEDPAGGGGAGAGIYIPSVGRFGVSES